MTKAKGDPRVSVELGGRTLPLQFNMGSVHDLMEATGLNILAGIDAGAMQDPRTMMALIWALAGGPDSGYETPRALAREVPMSELKGLSEAVAEVMHASNPLG